MNLLSISSNWTTNSDLEKCTTLYKDSDFQDFNEEDLDASNCVQLTRPNTCSDPPQVIKLEKSLMRPSLDLRFLIIQSLPIKSDVRFLDFPEF